MRLVCVCVLATLLVDADTRIDDIVTNASHIVRTSTVAVFGASNASHAQYYAAALASLQCGGHADRVLFLDGPALASAVALAAIGVQVVRVDGVADATVDVAPAALARLGYETALYINADVVAGPAFNCSSLQSDLAPYVTTCVAGDGGVQAFNLGKCEESMDASLPTAWNYHFDAVALNTEDVRLARLTNPWEDEAVKEGQGHAFAERWRAWAQVTAWPPTHLEIDAKCGCGDLVELDPNGWCAAGGCELSRARGTRMVSPVAIKFTTSGDVAGLRICFRVDGVEGGCVEAPSPMPRRIDYGFVTYPLHLRPGGHVVEAWLEGVVASHDIMSSAFEVTAFCERDSGRAHPCNRGETIEQYEVPFVAVAGCEGTGHTLLRNLSIDEWERRATENSPLFSTASYPHSQPRDIERRPNYAVSKPDFIVVLWREPARAAVSAARRFFRGGDVALGCESFTRNADALFEQMFALGKTRTLRLSYEIVVARPVDTVRGLARFLGLKEPTTPGRVRPATVVDEEKLAQARRLLSPQKLDYWARSLDALAPVEAADYAPALNIVSAGITSGHAVSRGGPSNTASSGAGQGGVANGHRASAGEDAWRAAATDEDATRAEIASLTAELSEMGELLNQLAAVAEPKARASPDLFSRGVVQNEAGDREGAAETWLAYLESVEARDCGGRAADAHFNLGVFFDDRGDLEMAGQMYAGALTCAPLHERSLQNAGANALTRGDAVAAVALFERACELNPSSDAHASNQAVAKRAVVVDDE